MYGFWKFCALKSMYIPFLQVESVLHNQCMLYIASYIYIVTRVDHEVSITSALIPQTMDVANTVYTKPEHWHINFENNIMGWNYRTFVNHLYNLYSSTLVILNYACELEISRDFCMQKIQHFSSVAALLK